MSLFLKIVGALTLLVVFLVGSFLVFIWMKLRGGLRGAGGSGTPATVNLVPDPDPAWLRKESAQKLLADLRACGYEPGQSYTITNMGHVRLVALHHPATGVFGCLYDHARVGHWVDLCANFSDGLELTVANAPKGKELDTRPDTKKIFLPGESVAALHAAITPLLAGRVLKERPPEKFAEEFAAAYARDMAWRTGKGGTSEEEFLRIAAGNGRNLTPEQLKLAFQQTKLQELRRWHEEILAGFEASTTLSVAEWKKFEHRMIIVRDSFHPRAFLEYLTAYIDLGGGAPPGKAADERGVLERERYGAALDAGLSLRGLLERIAHDTGCEFVRLGAVEQPQPTEIFGVKQPEKKPVTA